MWRFHNWPVKTIPEQLLYFPKRKLCLMCGSLAILSRFVLFKINRILLLKYVKSSFCHVFLWILVFLQEIFILKHFRNSVYSCFRFSFSTIILWTRDKRPMTLDQESHWSHCSLLLLENNTVTLKCYRKSSSLKFLKILSSFILIFVYLIFNV